MFPPYNHIPERLTESIFSHTDYNQVLSSPTTQWEVSRSPMSPCDQIHWSILVLLVNTLVNTCFIGSISNAWHRWPCHISPWKTFTQLPATTLLVPYQPHICNFNPKFYSELQIPMSNCQLNISRWCHTVTSILTGLKLNLIPLFLNKPAFFPLAFQISILLLLDQKSRGHFWLFSFSHPMSHHQQFL